MVELPGRGHHQPHGTTTTAVVGGRVAAEWCVIGGVSGGEGKWPRDW